MKPFPIPLVALGPGTQPVEEPPQYIASPGAMSIFAPPTPRKLANAAAVEGAREIIGRLIGAMEVTDFENRGSAEPSRADLRISLLEMNAGVVEAVNDLLGQGEVSALVTAGRPVRIQESAFAGVWRVHVLREDGTFAGNDLEAGTVPQVLRHALDQVKATLCEVPPATSGVMNAPAILGELIGASKAYHSGAETHVVNLTLLPVTGEDLEYLGVHLGRGPVTILSRGYGNCRISSTALPHTWWVQYFNSMDQLILNTIEVDEVPVVALAAPEDLEDSIVRLRDWVATL
ncbi:MAG TPA: hydrogenase expression/formation protein [Steroidobacteraceae bacterium]|nr:hydrogenase expression/formation protein [Steroidobacteraceae bacterium]